MVRHLLELDLIINGMSWAVLSTGDEGASENMDESALHIRFHLTAMYMPCHHTDLVSSGVLFTTYVTSQDMEAYFLIHMAMAGN